MKSLKTLFLPKHFFTLPVFISTYSWLSYVHLLDFTNNQGGMYLTRILILTLLFLFTIGLLFIVSKLIVERISINYAYLVFFAFIINFEVWVAKKFCQSALLSMFIFCNP